MTETRTIFLSTDGRHVTLAADPAEQMTLIEQTPGTCGWFALMGGDYYRRGKVSLVAVNTVNDAAISLWDDAVAAFMAARGR